MWPSRWPRAPNPALRPAVPPRIAFPRTQERSLGAGMPRPARIISMRTFGECAPPHPTMSNLKFSSTAERHAFERPCPLPLPIQQGTIPSHIRRACRAEIAQRLRDTAKRKAYYAKHRERLLAEQRVRRARQRAAKAAGQAPMFCAPPPSPAPNAPQQPQFPHALPSPQEAARKA